MVNPAEDEKQTTPISEDEKTGDDESPSSSPRDAAYWAGPVDRLRVVGAPAEAININVEGRRMVGPLQGFGQMWQKTFRIRLSGVETSPREVMKVWKEDFPRFQPPENRFFPAMSGIKPGEVLLIEAKVPPFPGTPSVLPVVTGVMVLYADEESFTVMNPQGHPLSGWNTFSVYEEEGTVVAQVQEQSRASDPLYEVFFRFLGSSGQQDNIWIHVLTSLAEHFGVKGQVTVTKTLVDPSIQWSQAKNIWHNAGIRTVFYLIGTPFRMVRKVFQR
jgi:hypothetical protein